MKSCSSVTSFQKLFHFWNVKTDVLKNVHAALFHMGKSNCQAPNIIHKSSPCDSLIWTFIIHHILFQTWMHFFLLQNIKYILTKVCFGSHWFPLYFFCPFNGGQRELKLFAYTNSSFMFQKRYNVMEVWVIIQDHFGVNYPFKVIQFCT